LVSRAVAAAGRASGGDDVAPDHLLRARYAMTRKARVAARFVRRRAAARHERRARVLVLDASGGLVVGRLAGVNCGDAHRAHMCIA
jgi:hypothetical protein